MSDTVESFSALLRNALGDRLTPDASSFAEMFHPDGVMEFPFAFGDMPKQVAGRDALIRHLSSHADRITFERMGKATVLETADPETVVLEFEGFGRGLKTGEPYEQRYVSIIRTKGGYIVHYKDYWNPLAVLRTLNGSKALGRLTTAEARHD